MIILIIILLGGVGAPYINPGWRYGYGYGHGGIGLIGIILIILVVLLFLGRFPY
jgi:hypothetical protein